MSRTPRRSATIATRRPDTMPQRRDSAPKLPAPPRPPTPAPPLARDRWAWLAALSVLPALFRARGTPLGEPVADDFQFLRPVLFHGLRLFDGGGAANYWRPIGRQLYYLLLGGAMLDRPWLVALLHVALLAASSLLLYRALRTRLDGPAAAAAATFPALMESARLLLAWPANFQDLGALALTALAVERASRGRTVAMFVAAAAALLCKEIAAPIVLLLPWAPVGAPRSVELRLRLTLIAAALVAVWYAIYRLVAAHAGLSAFASGAASEVPLVARSATTLLLALRSAFSLSPQSHAGDPYVLYGAAALAIAALVAVFVPRAGRRAVAWPLVGWGLGWFALASLTLVPLFPQWADYRAAFAAAGLGVALVALLAAAHPALPAALVALRLLALALAPGLPTRIEETAVERGSLLDFPKHARVQRLLSEVRTLLRERRPQLAHGSKIGQHYLPTMTEYAFEGSLALQSWYRDSTLRWLRFDETRASTGLGLSAVVEYQYAGVRQVALVEPVALAAVDRGLEALRAGRWPEGERAFAAADSLQPDRNARVFLAIAGAKRAVCLLEMRDTLGSARAAAAAYGEWPDNPDSRYVLASIEAAMGRLSAAAARLDTALSRNPSDEGARALREQVRAGSAALSRANPAIVAP